MSYFIPLVLLLLQQHFSHTHAQSELKYLSYSVYNNIVGNLKPFFNDAELRIPVYENANTSKV